MSSHLSFFLVKSPWPLLTAIQTHTCKNKAGQMFSLFSYPLLELEKVYTYWTILPNSGLYCFRSCPVTREMMSLAMRPDQYEVLKFALF